MDLRVWSEGSDPRGRAPRSVPDGVDEVLDLGPRRFRSPWLRAGGVLLVTAMALGALVLGPHRVRPVTRHRPPVVRVAERVHPAPTYDIPTIMSGPRTEPPAGVRLAPAICPAFVRCRRSAVPAPVLAAVRAALPGTTVVRAVQTVRVAGGRLEFREVTGRGSGGVQVLVRVSRVQPDGPRARTEFDTIAGVSVGYARRDVAGGYRVQVQQTGPPSWRPRLSHLARLADDPVLVSA